MDKRYQVFVSSTYLDLNEERAEVMQALLELDCMPSGMELFPAANEDQWNWIKKVIHESDYYIVIVGGRYGTVSPTTGLSYTEMEYRYAVEISKPIIGFFHEDVTKIIAGKSELDNELKQKLKDFRYLVQTKLCKPYSNPSDLGAKVSRSVTQLIKTHPAVGWVRADAVMQSATAEEILGLRKEIEFLQAKIKDLDQINHEEKANLQGGDDALSINLIFRRQEKSLAGGIRTIGYATHSVKTTWNEIFRFVSPQLIEGCKQYELRNRITALCEELAAQALHQKYKDQKFDRTSIGDADFNRIFIQLRALGLIEAYSDGRSWTLSKYGDQYLNTIIALKKSPKSLNNKTATPRKKAL